MKKRLILLSAITVFGVIIIALIMLKTEDSRITELRRILPGDWDRIDKTKPDSMDHYSFTQGGRVDAFETLLRADGKTMGFDRLNGEELTYTIGLAQPESVKYQEQMPTIYFVVKKNVFAEVIPVKSISSEKLVVIDSKGNESEMIKRNPTEN